MVLGLKPMGKPTTYKYQVLDRIKILHGPRTQTYGATNYLSKSSFGQNQSIAWSSDSNLWENQLLKYQVLDKTKVLHGPRTQTYGETNYLNIKFWAEPRYYVDLEVEPMKSQLLKKNFKSLSPRTKY